MRFPFPQLSSVDLGGCALGDVVTLAGLCRSTPIDSLALPLAALDARYLPHAAQSSRFEALGGGMRAGPRVLRKVVISDLLSFDDVSLAASCMGLRGTEDLTIRLSVRDEWGNYDGYDMKDLDVTSLLAPPSG